MFLNIPLQPGEEDFVSEHRELTKAGEGGQCSSALTLTPTLSQREREQSAHTNSTLYLYYAYNFKNPEGVISNFFDLYNSSS